MNGQSTGQAFENLIDYSNRVYEQKGIAIVHKREIPITITRKTARGIIGHLRKASLVDYEGFVKGGRSIQFEAKSTTLKRFDLNKIEEHQVQYLSDSYQMGAMAFLLVEFSELHEIWFLAAHYVDRLYGAWQTGGKASISHDFFEKNGIRVDSSVKVPVDYLSAVKRWWV